MSSDPNSHLYKVLNLGSLQDDYKLDSKPLSKEEDKPITSMESGDLDVEDIDKIYADVLDLSNKTMVLDDTCEVAVPICDQSVDEMHTQIKEEI